jgi:hypothetical protein
MGKIMITQWMDRIYIYSLIPLAPKNIYIYIKDGLETNRKLVESKMMAKAIQ